MDYIIIFGFIVILIYPASLARKYPVKYEYAQVWRTLLRTHKDVDNFRSIKEAGDMSVWIQTPSRADFLVFNKNQLKIRSRLFDKKLNHTVLIENVQRKIDATNIRPVPWSDTSLRIGHRLDFQNYPSIHLMDEFIHYLADNYPSMIRVTSIGNSVENRTIKMIRISNSDPNNKAMVIVAGQHAREWVGITSALYIANNIITKFDRQPNYIKKIDWYIVPLLNPDGYMHTHTTDRLWRKNRRKNPKKHCFGVDLNRNYPKHWQVHGLTQNNPCEEDYAGPFAFSEPESLALLSLLDSLAPKVPDGLVDLHAYGQMIMYPWGVKGKVSEHEAFLTSTGELIKSIIMNTTGHKYTHGTPISLLYEVSGTAIDWFHSKGVPLVYAIESRDKGAHGFLLPPDQIQDTGKEMLGAVKAVAKALNPHVRMRDGSLRKWF